MFSIAYLGRGGQGIVFAATITAEALYEKGYYVAQLQNYGASVRGGSVLGYVVADNKPIKNPFVEVFDVMIALHEEGLKRWKCLVEKSKKIIVDEKLVKSEVSGAIKVPLSSIAEEEGVYQALNLVAVRLAFKVLGITGIDEVMDKLLKNRKNYDLNKKAYMIGKEIVIFRDFGTE
ncbi:MAG: 2-oxoacid:acceptor oxidoreductase family protein [Staphylothermus sp.]|nr:2-oxoacid:acceptor oxidoreductase family protein [Staphylothermus sp.]